jgi:putative FmdB family regulatory protein
MPSYEYECRKCGHAFETMRKVDERDRPLPCPQCESTRVERKLSAFVTGRVVASSPGCSPEKAASCGNAGFG